ncbi:MAG: mycofactocin biosynthesis glycosyltransferase MftF [Acidimicrobiales bacterium]
MAGAAPRSQLPGGFKIAFDPRVQFWAGGRVVSGGSPWRVLRLAEGAVPFVSSLRSAGSAGAAATDDVGRALTRDLLDRGFAHPVIEDRLGSLPDVDVVVPIYGSSGTLQGCLEALSGLNVTVIDDASPNGEALRAVASAHGMAIERQSRNRGPATARNTGLKAARTELVAFVDADCRPQPGWLGRLIPHFDDPQVAAVAPRILPAPGSRSLLARYEATQSALDMGSLSESVRPGGRLGFVPSATLVVRRELVLRHLFDEDLRFGEDVDLVWRLTEGGWLVRYEPSATVWHEQRRPPSAWIGRRYAYGSSAGALALRHPGRLAPVRVSSWSVVSILLAGARHPISGLATAGVAAALLQRRLAPLGVEPWMALSTVGKGVLADSAGLGRALRREWWPIGALSLIVSGRSRRVRIALVLMLTPLVLEWVQQRPKLDPVTYIGLRLLDDAAYGAGVAAGALKAGTLEPFVPKMMLPWPLARYLSRTGQHKPVQRDKTMGGADG